MNRRISLDYHNLKTNDIAPFAQNIVDSTKNVKKYEEFKPEVLTIEAALIDFNAKVVAAEKGGTDRTEARDNAKKLLFNAMDNFAYRLMAKPGVDDSYYTDAGYTLVEKGTTYKGDLPMPAEVSVSTSSIKGKARLKYKLGMKNYVLYNLIEYQVVGGDGTWHVASRTAKSNILLENLPSKSDVVFRITSYGRHNNQSPSAVSAMVGVL